MVARTKYTKEHWDEFRRLVGTGLVEGAALRQMGIPKGSLGTLKSRFNGAATDVSDRPSSPPAVDQPIGELAEKLNSYTENLLDLTATLAELTRHAHGLSLLDTTLRQLEATQLESAGLRRRLEEAEARLIARAHMVHSND